MSLNLRQEAPADYARVAEVIEAAFEQIPYSDHQEQHLVARLRQSDAFVPELSIVAELDGQIVGYILMTRIRIRAGAKKWESLALAPVAVAPGYQRRGVGGRLIGEAQRVARQLGFKSAVLVGHATYYPRFGYRQAHLFGIEFPFDLPKENCMATALIPGGLEGVSGIVEYPSAFYGDETSN